jgi:hypothetical protein
MRLQENGWFQLKEKMRIGGSQSMADLLLGLIYGVFILGVTMALIYRKKRPEVYARIGRQ